MRNHPFKYSINTLLILSLLLWGFASCASDDGQSEETEGNTNFIKLNFSPVQAVVHSSRATGDQVAGSAVESAFHTMRAWLFDSNSTGPSAVPVSYREINDAIRYQDNSGQLSTLITVPKTVTNCDLYILGNAESLSGISTLTGGLTRGQLENMAFGTPPAIADLPAKGLPVSRIVKKINVAQFKNGKSTVQIPLLRAVGRVDFLFTKHTGMNMPSVTGITIAGNSIPNQAYVFPTSADYSAAISDPGSANIVGANGYETTGVTYPGISSQNPFTDIKEVDSPLIRGSSEDAQSYKDKLTVGASLVAMSYLKETDKTLSCTINYKTSTSSAEKSVTFDINGQLLRNHELVVYAYFSGVQLYAVPTVLDWTDGGTFDFSAQIKTNLACGPYKSDADGNVCVAYDKDNPTAYSNQLTLTVSSPEGLQWVLQSDNPDFGFVTMNNGVVSSTISDRLTGVGGDGAVTFYFIPKRDIDLTDPNRNYKADLYLTIPGYNEANSSKIPFNSGSNKLPGSETDILYNLVSKSVYNELISNK